MMDNIKRKRVKIQSTIEKARKIMNQKEPTTQYIQSYKSLSDTQKTM